MKNILNKIKVNYRESKNQDNKFTPYHTRFDVVVEYKGKKYKTDYQCNTSCNNDMEKDIVYCLLRDAEAFEYCQDIDDFQKEFGYDKVSDCIKAFEGCKKTYEEFQTMFDDEELEELKTIFEDY